MRRGIWVVMAALGLGLTMARADEPPLLRYEVYLLLDMAAADSQVVCQSVPYGRVNQDYTYGDQPTYAVLASDGVVLDEADGRLGEQTIVPVPKAVGAYALFHARPGNNYVTATPRRPFGYVATEAAPLNLVRGCERLYFLVPKGLSGATLFLHAFSVGEAARLVIRDPAGQVVREVEEDCNEPLAVSFPVPAGQDDRVWSLALLAPKRPGWKLDDCKLWLAGTLGGVLCPRPEWADLLGRPFSVDWRRVLDCETPDTVTTVQWDQPAAEGTPAPAAEVKLSLDQPWTGQQSLRVEFTVPREAPANALKIFTRAFPAQETRQVCFWLYGDGSGRKLTVRLRDSQQEHFYAPAVPITWRGWGQVQVDFTGPGVTSSGGDADKQIDGPQVSLVLQFAHNPGDEGHGVYYVDEVAVSP